jgi:nicotinate-nucleotide--dimethylbenzimidazole phosphoribosyltransferase
MGVAGDLSPFGFAGQGISKRIGPGTRNLAQGPAMTREEAIRSLEAGIEIAQALAPEVDVFGTGEMGIANTTASSAILAAISGAPVAQVTGRGTGIDEERLRLKVSVIEKSLKLNQPNPIDGLDLLAKVGGFEIGGLAGLMLGAASLRKPILVDGFISTAAALIATRLCPQAGDYLIAAHCSQEPGHKLALQCLGKEPLLDLRLRLGEGTGAALAMNLVEAAVRVLSEVATFEEASVSEADK